MSWKELEVIINSFIYSNFNYCLLVWLFNANKYIEKAENIHKRCLSLALDKHKSDYKTLLDSTGKESMRIRRIKTLGIEIFKTVNELNSKFMKSMFTSRTNSRVWIFDLLIKIYDTEKYGSKSLKEQRLKIRNVLHENIKKETSLSKFKEYIKSQSGPTCKWKIGIII